MKYFFSIAVVMILLTACNKNNPEIPGNVKLDTTNIKVVDTDIPDLRYTDVNFITPLIGMAVTNDGLVIKTTDGGNNWNEIRAADNFFLKKIQLLNAQAGYIIGGSAEQAFILKTNDGGANWQKTDLNKNNSSWPAGMFFLDPQTGFVAGKKYFLKTTDGGQSWQNVLQSADEDFEDINFKDKRTGYASTSGGVYYKTTDGGTSWQRFEATGNTMLKEIYFTANRTLIYNGSGFYDVDSRSNIVEKPPVAARKFLFVNDNSCIGIGQHYDGGYLPYGDIFLTNDSWKTSVQKTAKPNEALDFGAIARVDKNSAIIISTGRLESTVLKITF